MVCSLTCSIPSASWQQLPTEKSRNQGTCMVLNVFILSNCGHQRFWPSWHNRFGRFRLNLDSRTVYYILECMPLVLHVHHFAPLNSLLSFSWLTSPFLERIGESQVWWWWYSACSTSLQPSLSKPPWTAWKIQRANGGLFWKVNIVDDVYILLINFLSKAQGRRAERDSTLEGHQALPLFRCAKVTWVLRASTKEVCSGLRVKLYDGTTW